MIELAIIGSLIIGIIIFFVMRSKETVTYSGIVTMETIKEVAKLVTHESFISDFVKLYNSKGKEIALLHIDVKVQITFDLQLLLVKEGTNIIESFPEPDVVAIENSFISSNADDRYKQTDFILLDKAIYISRTNLEKIEKAYFEHYKKRPSVIREINRAKQNFLQDINSFALAMGSKTKIEFSDKLLKESQSIIDESESIDENHDDLKYFSYTLLDDEIEDSEDVEIEFNRLLLLINLVRKDSNLHQNEKEHLVILLNKSILPEDKKKILKKLLLSSFTFEKVKKTLEKGDEYVIKYTGIDYLNSKLEKIISDTPLERGIKALNKYTGIDYVNSLLKSEIVPDFDLLKQDNKIAEKTIQEMIFLSKIDNEICREEFNYIRIIAEMLDVKSEIIEEELKNNEIV